MKKTATILLAALLAILLCACSSASKNDGNSLVGKWELDSSFTATGARIPASIEFYSDKTVQGTWGGTYSCDGNSLSIYYSAEESYSYIYEVNGDTLYLASSGDGYNESNRYAYNRVSGDDLNGDNGGETDESTSYKNSLSAQCDYVLASGTSENGDFYELVVQENDSYDGSNKIGVIKNNKWLIEPTTDCPLIEDGAIIGFKDYKEYIQSGYDDQKLWKDGAYVFKGNNCFSAPVNAPDFAYVIWNVETGESYKTDNAYLYRQCYHYDESTDTYYPLGANDNYIVIEENIGNEKEKIVLLNTQDMTTKEIACGSGFSWTYVSSAEVVVSEGLFYAEKEQEKTRETGTTYNEIVERGFYDTDGNLMIDLSKYNMTKYVDGNWTITHFYNGECTFEATNDSGKTYQITIDKTGKVLSEVTVD